MPTKLSSPTNYKASSRNIRNLLLGFWKNGKWPRNTNFFRWKWTIAPYKGRTCPRVEFSTGKSLYSSPCTSCKMPWSHWTVSAIIYYRLRGKGGVLHHSPGQKSVNCPFPEATMRDPLTNRDLPVHCPSELGQTSREAPWPLFPQSSNLWKGGKYPTSQQHDVFFRELQAILQAMVGTPLGAAPSVTTSVTGFPNAFSSILPGPSTTIASIPSTSVSTSSSDSGLSATNTGPLKVSSSSAREPSWPQNSCKKGMMTSPVFQTKPGSWLIFEYASLYHGKTHTGKGRGWISGGISLAERVEESWFTGSRCRITRPLLFLRLMGRFYLRLYNWITRYFFLN